MKKKIDISYDETEWLYAHGFKYMTGENTEREIGLIFPYRREWNEDKRYPLVVYIPGAAWHRQELYNDVPKYAKLAERGIVFAILQVRESDLAPFPAQMEDIHRRISWLIDNAERFLIDTGRIFLAGNSSGGHLPLLAAFSKVYGRFVPADVHEYRLAGVIGEAAASDIIMGLDDAWPMEWGKRPETWLMGVETDEECRRIGGIATCKNYVEAGIPLPPVLLFHCDKDPIVSCQMSRDLYEKLIMSGHKADYIEISKMEHGGNVYWTREVLDMIEEIVKRS